MEERKDQEVEKRSAAKGDEVHEFASSAALSDLMSVSNSDLLSQKLHEIVGLLWLPPSLSEKEKNAQIVRAAQLFESLAPSDASEAMLAIQMVGTHSAAMECLRRAMIPEQSTATRDSCLRAAQKMMALYTRQLETLNRHRGKGQQKVTVEYVNVEAGAQAIVGTVETGNRRPEKRRGNAPKSSLEGSVTDISDGMSLQRRR
jgi:hypothetical protein